MYLVPVQCALKRLTCWSSRFFKCVGLSPNCEVPGLELRPPLDGGGIPIALDRAALAILSSSSLHAEVTGTGVGR